MRGNAGGHANGDAGAAVQQQEGKLGRKNGGFLLGPIKVRCEINRVLTDLLQHRLVRDRRQAGFGVPHGRRWVVIHRAEIAMAVEQWMTAGEALNKPHQGVVNGLITVGVVFAEDVTDNPRAFPIRTVWGEPQFLHRVQNPPLDGFETIAGIGQRPTHDHAHRVFEVGALHLLMQGDRLNALLSHSVCRSPTGRRSAYR